MRRFASLWFTAAATLAVALPQGAGAQEAFVPPSTPPGSLGTDVASAVDDALGQDTPGALVLRYANGRTERFAAGVSSVETGRPMRPRDRFRAGSVTKTLVSAALLQEIGRRPDASLDDTVDRWLPRLVRGGDQITLRQLLSHTSGLGVYNQTPEFLGWFEQFPNLVVPFPLLTWFAGTREPVDAPGGSFTYSNGNYVVAGAVLSAMTGKPWQLALRESVLEPLRLRDSRLPSGVGLPARGYTRGYLREEITSGPLLEVTDSNASLFASSGALTTSTDDLARFLRGLARGKVLSPELLDEMATPTPQSRSVLPGGYGLGLYPIELPCGLAYGHDGELYGNSTMAFSSPDGSRQAVTVFNRGLALTEREIAARSRVLQLAFCGPVLGGVPPLDELPVGDGEGEAAPGDATALGGAPALGAAAAAGLDRRLLAR